MTARFAPLLFASALALSTGGKTLPQGRAEPLRATGCADMGPGFVKLEGSDTCVRFGGSVRAEIGIGSGGHDAARRP